jgi:hypothetical protein
MITQAVSVNHCLEIALPMAERGVRVVIAKPGERFSRMPNWQHTATTDPEVLRHMADKYPDWTNGVCMAHMDDVCIVDIDDAKAAKAMGMPSIPSTFHVKSPHGHHLYFRQTERSRALYNRIVRKDGYAIVELKVHHETCAAPGCIRDDGGEYVIRADSPLADFPDSLADWVQEHTPAPTKFTDGVPVHEDFDLDDFLDFYDITAYGQPWHH